MGARARGKITAWECRCNRCSHTWTSKGRKPPGRCANCKSRYWNVARTRAPKR